nr:TI-kininogen=plasma T-kinin precursor isoform I {N-terminal} [rats, Sprague-Dawley, Peptide Partial, 15 aa] [Rattus sp.]
EEGAQELNCNDETVF